MMNDDNMSYDQRAREIKKGIDMGLKIASDFNDVVTRNIDVMRAGGMHPASSLIAIGIAVETYREYIYSRDPEVRKMLEPVAGIISEAVKEMTENGS